MNRRKPYARTSFISEHSAEFVLVPNLVEILSATYSSIVPIYFWATREGSRIAASGVEPRMVRLVTVFARRPKVQNPNDEMLLVKINARLVQAGELGRRFGSPVFVGVPLATNLLRFHIGTPCAWFYLAGSAHTEEDVYIRLSLKGERQNSHNNASLVQGVLTHKEILAEVSRNAGPMTWQSAVEVMKNLRHAEGDYGWFMTGYRPFFLIIPE